MEKKIKKNILFVSSSAHIAGGETNLLALLNSIDDNEIDIYCMYNPLTNLNKYILSSSIRMFPFEPPTGCGLAWKLSVINTILRLYYFFLSEKINLLYINNANDFRYFSAITKILRVPVIVHVHINETDECLRWIRINRADRIIFPSKSTMQSVLEHSPWIDSRKCFYVHNAVDLTKFYPRSTMMLKEELGLHDNLPIIGIVGQLKKIKGQHLFLKMAQELKELGVNGHFLVVGRDNTEQREYEKLLKQKAAELRIQDQVIFLGYRTDIPEIMSLLDLLVVPSLKEPFGRVVIEAMACGTPVVASAVDGILEIFEAGEGGLFFKVGDVKGMTNKIKYFFDHPQWWGEQKKKAIQIVQKRFTQEKHTAAIQRHIIQVSNEHRK